MHPVVRITSFAIKAFFVIIAASAVWWAALIYLLVTYGLLDGITFATVSIMLAVLICDMIYHDRP